MAVRRKTAQHAAGVTITATDATSTPVNGDEPSDQTTDQLARSTDEGQKPPKARIDRWNEELHAYATLAYVPAAQVDGEYIASEYGGGKYLVYYWGTKAGGEYGYLKGKGKEFIIDTSIPFKNPRGARGAIHNPDGSVAAAAAAPSGMQSLMDMGLLQLFKGMQDASSMQAQQARDHSAAMMAMLERMAKPTDSQIPALLTVLSPIIAPLIAGLMARKDPVELATQIAALREKGSGGLGELDTLLDLAERLNKRVNGEDELTMTGVLKDSLPKVLDIFGRYAAQRASAPSDEIAPPERRVIAAAAQAAPAALVAPPAPVQPPMPSDEWTSVEPYIPQLVGFAQNDADPHGVAMTILTLAPGPLKAMIRDLVAKETAAEIFVGRFPALAPYTVWTAQLLDEFHAELFGDDGDEPPAETPAPGAANADEPAVG